MTSIKEQTASNNSPDNQHLYISEQVIGRLATGEFRPIRKRVANYHLPDRRDRLSPLAVTKRCIRYDPHVFFNRSPLVLDVAKAINNPNDRILMIGGNTGLGKTSFVRGVVEMMGGTPAQLLWFDVTATTDVDQITRFMVEYLLYVFESTEESLSLPENLSPANALKFLLEKHPEQNILLVLDNVELLVSHDDRFRAKELRDMVLFLQGFENIKILLSGTRLPLAEFRENARHWFLTPLSTTQIQDILKSYLSYFSYEVPDDTLNAVAKLFKGNPQYVWVWIRLLRQLSQSKQQRLLTPSPEAQRDIEKWLLDCVTDNIQAAYLPVMNLFSLVRHGMTPTVMKEFVSFCTQEQAQQFANSDHLERSMLGALLKKVYPPQSVLNWLHKRESLMAEGLDASGVEGVEPSYAMIDIFAERVRELMPLEEKAAHHLKLSELYSEEKRKPSLERLFPVKNSFLLNEVQYHQQLARLQEQFSKNPLFQKSRRAQSRSVEQTLAAQDDFAIDIDTNAVVDITGSDDGSDIPIFTQNKGKSGVTVLRTGEDQLENLDEQIVVVGKKSKSLPNMSVFVQGGPTGDSTAEASSLYDEAQYRHKQTAQSADAPKSDDAKTASVSQQALPFGQLTRPQFDKMPDALDADASQVTAYVDQARFYHFEGQFAQARLYWYKALNVLKHSTDNRDRRLIAEVYYALAMIYHNSGYKLHSLYGFKRALKALPEGDARLANCHYHLAVLYDDANKLKKAQLHYAKSFKVYQQAGEKAICATILFNIAEIEGEFGRYEQAAKFYEDSYRLDSALGNNENALKTLLALINAYKVLQQFDKVETVLTLCESYAPYMPKIREWIGRERQQLSRVLTPQ